ncbi:hypothetical protein JCM6882_005160 [Rhodosporidiobolus microsporus]
MPRYRYSTPLLTAAALSLSAFLLLVLALVRSYTPDGLGGGGSSLVPYLQRVKSAWEDRWSGSKAGDGAVRGATELLYHPTPGEEHLLPCARTLLVYLGHSHRGFGSLFNGLLRTAAVAEHYGYEVFVVEQEWMYGSLDDYFSRPNRTCTAYGTPDWSSRPEMKSDLDESPLAWLSHNHLREFRSGSSSVPSTSFLHTFPSQELSFPSHSVDYMDALFLSLFAPSPPETLTALHADEVASYPPRLPLDGFATVPVPMHGMMDVLERQAGKWWRPNGEVATAVEAAKVEIEREVRERGKQRPVIGVHVRLGDKCNELHNPSYSPLRYADPPTLQRFRSTLGAACSASPPSSLAQSTGPMDSSTASTYATAVCLAARSVSRQWRTKTSPLVLVMSDDLGAVEELKGVVEGGEVRGMGEFGRRDEEGGEGEEKGFSSKRFGELPLDHRIASTRTFIRDLTLLGSLADAFVFTGSSNVGRLLAVLGGTEKAKAGRDYSCDVRVGCPPSSLSAL